MRALVVRLIGALAIVAPAEAEARGTTRSPQSHFNDFPALDTCDADARQLGARGDGVTDDTSSLQSAINGMADGKTLCIPNGTYMIDAKVSLKLKNHLRLKMSPGAILKAIPNSVGSYAILELHDLSDVTVDGGVIVGERNQHRVVGSPGEWGMGIDIRSSSKISIRRVEIRDCWGDGIYLGVTEHGPRNYSSNVDIVDVIADSNRRQGISLISGENIAFLRPVLRNTHGTAPAAGLDIEPNQANERVKNVFILDPVTVNNEGNGILIDLQNLAPDNSATISIRNHIASGNRKALGVFAAGQRGLLEMLDNTWQKYSAATTWRVGPSFNLILPTGQ